MVELQFTNQIIYLIVKYYHKFTEPILFHLKLTNMTTTKSTMRLLFVSLISIIFFFSCKKSIDPVAPVPPGTGPTLPDLTTKVSTSISGYVTDQNDAAVLNATIQIGSTSTATDKYGYFQAINVQVVQNAAVVTAAKPGYFKSIRTFIAEAGKPAVLRIKMIPKVSSGTVSGTTGGTITLPNNLSIIFPASAVVNAVTNTPYTGSVTVSAFWIDPTAGDLALIMPGDLRGLNTQGNLQLLTTYGMAAVEMNGSGGELLQIAPGKNATLSFPIPAALSGSAPATIPLWFFDEVKGLWKQEGTATKTGNNYVGNVTHFSFWNVDVPANFVQFNCTVVSSNGQPITSVRVKISVVSNPASSATGYTNAAGYVNGAVPINQQLLLEVFTGISCPTPVYSQNFTTTNVNLSLGNITLPAVATATVSGTVLNCTNSPVTNGFIIIQSGFLITKFPLSNTGTYTFNHLLCGTSNNITLIGEDITASQQSNPAVYPITMGANTISTIQACGVSTQEYLNYFVNGVSIIYTAPGDNISLGNNATNLVYHVGANRIPYNPADSSGIGFIRTGIAAGSMQNMVSFKSPSIPANATINTPINVNITEFGSIGIGQYVAGNFAGTLTGPAPTNTPYNISGNFRVKRTF